MEKSGEKRMKKLRIGVLLDDLEGVYAGNIWPGILEAGGSLGVSLVFFIGRTYWPGNPALNQYLFVYDISVTSDLDGLIVCGSISMDWNDDRKAGFFSGYSRLSIPVVTIGVKYSDVPNITSDASGIKEAVKYFRDQGRKAVAFITGVDGILDSQERLRAFREGMSENGMELREERIIPGAYTYDSGVAAADRILELSAKSGPHGKVDAVVSSNDEMVFAMMNRFLEKGVRVPEDIGMVGFDDSKAVLLRDIRVASVNPSLDGQAKRSIEALARWIREGTKPDDLSVPSRLVVRESMDAKAVSENPKADDSAILQSYRHYLWSFRNLFGYFNKSDNLRDILTAFARYLVPSQNIRYCQIVLFQEPVAGEVDPDIAECRPVFLSRDFQVVYSLGRSGSLPMRNLPEEMKELDGNFLVMALAHQEIKFGYIVFDFSITDATFVYEELRNIISIFLKNIMDYKSLAFMNRKKEQDMQIARTVQDKFLTFKMKPNQVIDVETLYEPMMDVSGDFYQVTELSEGRIGVFIGDVTGHGMSAAMIASMAIMGMQIYQGTLHDPSVVLARINDQIYSILPDFFLTAFYGVIDCASRTMTYSNAGHPYPFLFRKETGCVEVLESTGKMIGCFEDPRLETRVCRLMPGDRLLIYTDGIAECTDRSGREFGEEKLRDILERNVPFNGFFSELMSELGRFRSGGSFEDDLTAVLIEMKKGPDLAAK
jgi:serine phosphatase RsbU (regulator of sigma subunit)/DNA-binding LacI/PurR family transcriptional regulator